MSRHHPANCFWSSMARIDLSGFSSLSKIQCTGIPCFFSGCTCNKHAIACRFACLFHQQALLPLKQSAFHFVLLFFDIARFVCQTCIRLLKDCQCFFQCISRDVCPCCCFSDTISTTGFNPSAVCTTFAPCLLPGHFAFSKHACRRCNPKLFLPLRFLFARCRLPCFFFKQRTWTFSTSPKFATCLCPF